MAEPFNLIPAASSGRGELIVGDCLTVLAGQPVASFDLAYLDPPFFTQRDHHLSSRDQSQSYSFADQWNDLAAYLDFLKQRLVAVRRVLKQTASLYFHCDRTASHHIRLLLDEVFGADQFRSEIIWSYRRWSNSRAGLLNAHQTIYLYSMSEQYTFNRLYEGYSAATNLDQILQKRARTASGKTVYARDEAGNPILNGPKPGVPLSDVWEIPYLNPKARERTGYPTQKPLLLVERMLALSSKPGERVLEPFCGSGPAVVAAQLMERNYLGIDIAVEAVSLTAARLRQPIRSESALLAAGRESYDELPASVKAVLAGLRVKPVQRNAGVDAIHDEFVSGRPVLVRVQRAGEQLSEAADKLRAAGQKRSAGLLLLIQTEVPGVTVGYFGEDKGALSEVVVVPAISLAVEQAVASRRGLAELEAQQVA